MKARPLTADDERHGTINAYKNYRCRCDACRMAHTEYCRRRGLEASRGPYAKDRCPACNGLKLRVSKHCIACAQEIIAKHGTESKYRQGCRCDQCRAAMTEARRRRRHANLMATRAYDREYKRRRAGAAS